MSDVHYGLARPNDVMGRTGREILRAIIDGRLPQAPISKTMSFWIVEVGEGFAASRASREIICSIRWARCMAAGCSP